MQEPRGTRIFIGAPTDVVSTRGLALPGELGIGLHLRKHDTAKLDFMQLDGRTNIPLSVGLHVRPPTGDLRSVDVQLRNLPEIDASTAAGDPSFRVRFENMGDPNPAAPNACPPDPFGVNAAINLPTPIGDVTECQTIDAAFLKLNLAVDMAQQPGHPRARRLDAVVRLSGGRQGVEYEARDSVTPGQGHPAPIKVTGSFDVEFRELQVRTGEGGLALVLKADITGRLFNPGSSHFSARVNVLNLAVRNDGPQSAQLSLDVNVHKLWAQAVGGHRDGDPDALATLGGALGPSALYGGMWLPEAYPLALSYYDCNDPRAPLDKTPNSPAHDHTLVIDAGAADRLVNIWPYTDPRIVLNGIGVAARAPYLAVENMCPILDGRAWTGDLQMISPSHNSDMRMSYPGDPLWHPRVPVEHAVPGSQDASTRPAQPAVTSSPQVDLAVATGDTNALYLCGAHSFKDITVPAGAFLRVADQEILANGPDGKPKCRAADVGRLALFGRTVSIAGFVIGDGVIHALHVVENIQPAGDPTGNGGASHGARGGQGSTGLAGNPYGDFTDSPVTEPGQRGSGTDAGKGGGALSVSADNITVTGSISLTGGNGADAPGAADFNNCNGSSGGYGAGGGSGGGLVLAANKLTVNGAINVSGGAGGNGSRGGGGGGGAGIVKLLAPISSIATEPYLQGGGWGADACGFLEGPPHNHGRFGEPIPNTTDARLNIRSTTRCAKRCAPDELLGEGRAVVLLHRGCPRIQAHGRFPLRDRDGGTANNGLPAGRRPHESKPMRQLARTVRPRHRIDDSARAEQRPTQHDHRRIQPAHQHGVHQADADLATDIWNVWTVAFSNCSFDAAPEDLPCEIEGSPSFPDLVIQVENTPPAVAITAPENGLITQSREVPFTYTATDSESGIAEVRCRVQNAIRPCDAPIDFLDEGQSRIDVRATDGAGYVVSREVIVLVDHTAPSAAAHIPALPAGAWYGQAHPLSISINGYDDRHGMAAADVSGASTSPIEWWFDGGAKNLCSTTSCSVPASDIAKLTAGVHTFHYTPVDRAGNRQDASGPCTDDVTTASYCYRIRVDQSKPHTSFDAVSARSVGPWLTGATFAVVTANDQLGASGLAAVEYNLDNGGWTPYEAPFPLDDGVHSVCWRSTDNAGNVEPAQCRGQIYVDANAPEGELWVTPEAPDGADGWYRTVPR